MGYRVAIAHRGISAECDIDRTANLSIEMSTFCMDKIGAYEFCKQILISSIFGGRKSYRLTSAMSRSRSGLNSKFASEARRVMGRICSRKIKVTGRGEQMVLGLANAVRNRYRYTSAANEIKARGCLTSFQVFPTEIQTSRASIVGKQF